MKTPFKGDINKVSPNLPDSAKQRISTDGGPRYCYIRFNKPIQQDGHGFSFLVLGLTVERKEGLKLCGPAVLCQTESEAIESQQLLSLVVSGDMGLIRSGNLACPVFLKRGARFLVVEQACECKTLPGGKKTWRAIERTINRATGEVKVERKKEGVSKKEAMHLAQKWAAESNGERQKHVNEFAKSKVPLPPSPDCDPLNQWDMKDAETAQTEVLRRQWRHCFRLFDMRKAGHHFSIDDCRKAYLLDLAELRENPFSVQPPNGTTREFFDQLAKAWTRASKAKKKLISQRADYLIAFNYPLSWCYLSDQEIAERIGSIVKHPFTAGQIKKRRQRLGPSTAPGLVSKHHPGPPSKLPEGHSCTTNQN